MPFTLLKKKRKGQRLYRSPSGRTFTARQVKRYYARGGRFDAACACGRSHDAAFFCDAATITKSDPTGTLSIRRAFARELDRRWRLLKLQVNKTVRNEDQFGLSSASIVAAQVIASSGGQLKAFQVWLDAMLSRLVFVDGHWIDTYISRGYIVGSSRAVRLVNRSTPVETDRIELLASAAAIELQGVMEAVSQQAVRAFSNALIGTHRPRDVAFAVNSVIDKTGVLRGHALASFTVVQAHAQATLDAFQALGVQRVGINPETQPTIPTQDAPRRPSASAVRRARTTANKLNRLELVNVETAGDNKVCPICEQIEEDGPYTIDEARSLIPAHPSCRCAFIPLED